MLDIVSQCIFAPYYVQIQRKQDAAAMAFAQKVLLPAATTEEDKELLNEAMALFAYQGSFVLTDYFSSALRTTDIHCNFTQI